jgi:hypothetical protein
MDMLKKLSMPAQAVLAGVVLYIIFSFFDWQQACFGPVCAGVSEWHGGGGTIPSSRRSCCSRGSSFGSST